MSLVPFILKQFIKQGIKSSSKDEIFEDFGKYVEKKYGDRENTLIVTLKRYFNENCLGVVEPKKRNWQDISTEKDFLEKSFDELYNSLIKTNTKEDLKGLDEFTVKKMYLAITVGSLLAVINKSKKETFRELAISGILFLYLQDITSPIFDEFLGETIYPSFDDNAKIELHKIISLFLDELIAKGWLECLEEGFSSSNLNVNVEHLSEELIRYYFIKKEEFSIEVDNYLEKLYS